MLSEKRKQYAPEVEVSFREFPVSLRGMLDDLKTLDYLEGNKLNNRSKLIGMIRWLEIMITEPSANQG